MGGLLSLRRSGAFVIIENGLKEHLRSAKWAYMDALMRLTKGRVNEAAKLAKVNRRMIRRLLTEFRMDKKDYR